LFFYDNLTNEYLQVEDNYAEGLMHVLQRSKTGLRGPEKEGLLNLVRQLTRGFSQSPVDMAPKTPKMQSAARNDAAPTLLNLTFQKQMSKPLAEMVRDDWRKEPGVPQII